MHRISKESRKLVTFISVSLFALSGLALAACNTSKGVGQDIEALGDNIEDAADEAAD